MNKIVVCFVIVNCKITGPMNQTLNIIKNMDKNKFDISFITLFKEEANNSMLKDYLNVCKKHYCLNLNRLSSLLYGNNVLKRKLDEICPDIVHAVGMPPYRLSLKYKTGKHLVTLRNYVYEDYPSYYNKLIGPILAFLDINLIKKLQKRGEKFVTCSKSLSTIYLEKEKIKLDYIRNGVDLKRFKKKSDNDKLLRKKLNIPLDKIVLIYTAPFNDRKNQEELILSFNKINNDNIVLVLCGNGDNYENLKNKYSSKSIIFTGKVKNVDEYLRASDIYVSSSKSEGLPNSVLEAMATGLPVILSNILQHKELIELDEIGYCYELGNLIDLSEKINKMISQNYERFGENSFKCVKENLTSVSMSEKYQNLYCNMLESDDK